MDRHAVIADLKRASQSAMEAAIHIDRMVTKLTASYGVTMTSIYAERSHAAQSLDRALTIIQKTHHAGL